jgi:hypothetical protein
VNGDVISYERDFIVNLHFVEEPVRVALKYLCEVHAEIASWFTKAVHDSAQGSLVNAQHSRQPVLTDARGIHAQLQIRVNVSIQSHSFALAFYEAAASCREQKRLLMRN